MKSIFNLILLAMVASACNGQSYEKAPLFAPNRQNRHVETSCPSFSGNYVNATATRMKTISNSLNRNGTPTMNDSNKYNWIVDATGHYMNGNRLASYVAYCTSNTPASVDTPTPAASGNIVVEIYDDQKGVITSTMTYESKGTGFHFSYVDMNNEDLDPADDYTLKK